MMLLSTRKLCKEYQRGATTCAVVNGVDFCMDEGEVVCIAGRSGSGKTTFISMLAGHLVPTSGDILLDGVALTGLDDKQLSAVRHTVISYIPQGLSLLPTLTAVDNIRLPLFLGSKPAAADAGVTQAEELMEKTGILHLRNAYPQSLSGGEMRRVAIARALLSRPKLLIADEPTSDLDRQTTAEILQLLLQINAQGTALLIVSHDSELSRFAARTCLMDNGVLTQQ